MLSATSSFTHASTKRPPVPFSHAFKGSFGLGFLALAAYEAGAPALQIEPTNLTGIFVAGGGVALGLLISQWR